MNVELDILPRDALLSKHGLQPGGPVQKMVDSETMRYMAVSYTHLDVYKRQ